VKTRRWRRGRQIVQAVSFLLSIALVVYTLRDLRSLLSADMLLRLDPLAAIAAMLSSRRWLASFVPAIIIVIATLVLGRFWCGWLCPLGTLIDWTSPRSSHSKAPSPRWRVVKYLLLFVTLFAALWGNLTMLILDPLTLFVRSVGTLALPAIHWLVMRAEMGLYKVTILRGILDVIDSALQGTLLSYKQPHYGGVLLTAGLLGGVLALNLLARRAWCRYFCPLGGLLSLLAKASWLKRRVNTSCVGCGICARGCRMGTIDDDRDFASDSGECILCLDCVTNCPEAAIAFGGDLRLDIGHSYDPTRRHVIGALGASLGIVALLKIAPSAHHPNPYRLRPPGTVEDDLLAACIRCGACIRACPSHGLQPSLTQSGFEGLSTPILVPKLGHCEYSCNECGIVCPTGAIPHLSLEHKQATVIGKAYIDPKICIAWSGRGDCIVCEEMCPVPEKAIILQEEQVADQAGDVRLLQVPVVLYERCIGCGLCENKCPVSGEAAIRVIVDPLG